MTHELSESVTPEVLRRILPSYYSVAGRVSDDRMGWHELALKHVVPRAPWGIENLEL